MTNEQNFQLFVADLNQNQSHNMVSLIHIGSSKGIKHPHNSDIDLLAIVKTRTNITELYEYVRSIEAKYLHLHHTKFTDLLQRTIWASNDTTGVHLLVITEDKIGSRKLKLPWLTSFFASENIFLYSLKKEGRLLFGDPKYLHMRNPKPGFKDRVISILFPVTLLILSLAFVFNRKEFVKWVLKCLKVHIELVSDYYRLKTNNENLEYDQLGINPHVVHLATVSRYHIANYKRNRAMVFIETGFYILKQIPYIFSDKFYKYKT